VQTNARLPLHYADAPRRFSAVGLPGGPNIRIRLLGDRPERRAGFSKPIVALMQERSAAWPRREAIEKRLRRLDEQGLLKFDVVALPLP
jgi:hypothetical protein